MPNKSETKSYGSIRKFKSYGACGVIIGMAALSLSMNAGVAHADEKVNPNPATNAVPLQDNPTENAKDSQAKTGTEKGSLDVAVNNDTLKNEVNKAKEAGVKVVEDKPKEVTVASDKVDEAKAAIEKDYQTQAAEVKKATDKYKEDVANRKNQVTIVEKKNEAAEAKYKAKLAEIKKQEEALKAKGVFADNDQFTIYGKLDESKKGSLDYYSDLSVVFKNKDNNLETVNGGLGANSNTTLELVDKIKVDTERENVFKVEKASEGLDNYAGHVLTDIQKGSTFILHNVGQTNSGKTISAKFTSRNTPKAKFPLGAVNRGSKTSLWLWWDKSKIQNGGKSEVGFLPHNYLDFEWDIEYFDEETKKPLNLGTISAYSDIDYTQSIRHTYDSKDNVGAVINPPGSKVIETTVNGERVWEGIKSDGTWTHDDETGVHDYKTGDPIYTNVHDVSAVPEGSILSVGSGKVHHLNYYSDPELRSRTDAEMAAYRRYYDNERDSKGLPRYTDEALYRADYAFQLWGAKSVVNTIVVPPKPEYDAIPGKVDPPTVNVQYTNLKTNVKIEKHVKNSKGEDVNNHSVPKLAEVVWELEAKPLAAGREETNILQYTDDLPKGYQLDVAKTQSQNPEFDVKYNSSTHSIVGTLKTEGLAKANKDRNVAYTVPTLKLYGTVMNDAATYTNNYHLNVNNKFDVYSNTVTVTTPGDPNRPKDSQIKPVKVNYNKDHVKIDGKQVLAGSTNYYHINLDYDQYKGIKSGPDAIQKGFGAVDDYPEQALDLLPNEIKYVETESGKEVKGITAYQFKSIEDVKDPRIKAILESSKIKPKGAFQVFMADNPQEFYDKYVSKGISVTIIDPMKVKSAFSGNYENKAYQIDFGNGYEADLVKNNVVTPEPHKKNLNSKGVDINSKPVVAGSVNHYHVTADYSKYKGMVVEKDRLAKGLFVVDDYPEQAVDIETGNIKIVDSKGKTVEGVTSKVYKSLEEAPKLVQDALKEQGFKPKGAFQVFTPNDVNDYFNKYVVTGEKLTYIVPMKVKSEMAKTGGKYENTAYQLDFGSAKVTETVVNNVPTPKPNKANFNKAHVNINGKQVLAGSTNYYELTVRYDQYKGIEADDDKIQNGFFIADDFPEEAVSINEKDVKVLDSKGKEVEGLKQTIYKSLADAPEKVQKAFAKRNLKPKGAIQVFEAVDPIAYYNKYVRTGETLTVKNPMTVYSHLYKTGAKYQNTAYQLDFGLISETETVVNNVPTPKPNKANFNKAHVNINGKQVLAGSTNYYELTVRYDQYKGIEADDDKIQNGFFIADDFPEEAVSINEKDVKVLDSKGKEVEGLKQTIYKSLADAPEKVQKAFAKRNLKPKGAIQVFEAVDPIAYYNKYVRTGETLTVKNPMTVYSHLYKTGAKYQNTAYQLDFGLISETETVVNNVPKTNPHKQNLNKAGVSINGKPVVAGTVNYYTLTADYSSYKGIEADADRIAKGFHIVDDFPEEAVTVNEKEIVVKDSKGNVVTGLKSKVYKTLADASKGVQESLKSAGYTPKGAIQVLTAENPTEFYNKYVRTGEVLTITNPMTVRKEMLGKIAEYKNTAYQLDFGLAKVTETVVNKVVKPTPKKANFNKAGVNIDGKQVFAGSINYYHVTADYSQYKGIQADKSRIAQGFFIADDYPEDVLDVLSDGIKLSDSKGQDVKGLKYHVYESIEKAPEVLRNALTERGFKPKGAFQVWEAENPAEFYAKYVQTGDTITIINPMKVKEKFSKTGGKYENTAYQVDFGVAEVTVTVVNNIPKFETKKDVVVSLKDKESKDGKEIVLGQKFFYSFDGSLITANRAEDLFEYKFVDDYQETHDRFDGVYKVIAKKDFKTSDGKTFKKGDDLTSYSFLKEDKTKGKLEVGLKEEFLRSITNDSEFQAEVFVEMTRIKSGEVKNKQTHVVNGVEVESNTVKTTTPEPPKTPETPTPKPQTPAKKVLPNTGADASVLGIVMAGITSALGAIGLKRKRD